MPHLIPTSIIVIRSNGVATTVMPQQVATHYLANLINTDRHANLKQSMNQACDGNGKPSDPYMFNGFPVYHASSGNGEKSCSLFYYMDGSEMKIFAMGEHKKGKENSYHLRDFGQDNGNGPFSKGRNVPLSK